MHATVRKILFQHFDHMLQEGKVYTIRNLKIDSANEKYKPLKGTVRGIFLLTTTLKEINDPNIIIPQHYFEFASLQTLSEKVGERMILIGNLMNIKDIL